MSSSITTAESCVLSPETDQLNRLILKLVDQQGVQYKFNINVYTRIKKLMLGYCKHKNIQYGSVRFIYHGQRLSPDFTPHSLMMEDGDEVCVFEEMIGGGRFVI